MAQLATAQSAGRRVRLGDSISSGEGTLYGYTYDPTSKTWTGGNLSVTWPGPYPLCHDSPDAYGQVAATEVEAAFAQFGCTGATFANGISAAEVVAGYFENTTLRPAEFGNWATLQNLNADYDAARPDLVLITLGVDDVKFVAIVEACIENGYTYAGGIESLECVAANPGNTVQNDFFAQIPTLQANYETLVSWIQARGKQAGKVPKILFTTYHNPMPPTGVTCTDQPWAYGLSIYTGWEPSSFQSPAPFHPTPQGHQRIAQLLLPVVDSLFPTASSTSATTRP